MRKQSGSFKRLIRKYEFLLEDWKDVEDIATSANQEFMREIAANKPDGISEGDYTVEDSEDDERVEETESDRVLKKLFRKIVLQCHPDRLIGDFSELERIRRISLYEQAVSAHDDKNWALMVITAIKLDVELPEEAEDMLDKIEEEAQELEQKISSTTSGITWQYYHADEDQKLSILNNYLEIIKMSKKKKVQIEKDSNKERKLILGVGHPRTGTGYTAKLLQSWGLDVGHESMGEHGTVDWSLAPGEESLWQGVNFKEFNWEHIIYCVRDPRDSIASIAYTENIETSLGFRKKFNKNIENKNLIVSAILSIIEWDQMITNLNPSFIYKVEDSSEKLFKYLKESGVDIKENRAVEKNYNSRDHKSFKELLESTSSVPSVFKNRINRYCDRYGYDKLF